MRAMPRIQSKPTLNIFNEENPKRLITAIIHITWKMWHNGGFNELLTPISVDLDSRLANLSVDKLPLQ